MNLISFPKMPNLYNLDSDTGEGIWLYDNVGIQEKIHGCVSFATSISMADGSRKKITKVKQGDLVLGLDVGGKLTTAVVTNKFCDDNVNNWLQIKGDKRGAGRGRGFFSIKCTPEHKFWNPRSQRYVRAGDLSVGDSVSIIRAESILNPISVQILLGMLLGDASLRLTNSTSAMITWGHKIEHGEYMDWIQRGLGAACANWRGTRISGYGTTMLRGRTINAYWIKDKFDDFHTQDGKRIPEWATNEIGPIALAFWYMDDGSLSHESGQEDRASFATCSFNEKDCLILLKALEKFGIVGTYCRYEGYSRLRLQADEAEKLFLLIAPYIPSCMQYKLPKRYRGHSAWLPPEGREYKPIVTTQYISSIEDTEVASKRHDLETTSHNYFANGILVHNSQTRIGISYDKIIIGSRRQELNPSNQGQKDQYDVCLDIISKVRDKLLMKSQLLDFRDVMLFGEFAGPAIQKGIDYGEERGLYIFDIVLIDKETEERNWLDVSEVMIFCNKWGLTPVPTLMRNVKPSLELFNSLYDIISQVIDKDDNTIEGIVIKTMPVAFDAYGDPVYAKHKNDKWSEKLPKMKQPGEVPKVVQYITKTRVLHGIDKLKEDDLFTRHMQDMKYLADVVTKDIIEEEKVEGEYKSIRRVISKRVARIYKTLLLKGEV